MQPLKLKIKATTANIVSPLEGGEGRTALDVISFAVENKSITKASFQSCVQCNNGTYKIDFGFQVSLSVPSICFLSERQELQVN